MLSASSGLHCAPQLCPPTTRAPRILTLYASIPRKTLRVVLAAPFHFLTMIIVCVFRRQRFIFLRRAVDGGRKRALLPRLYQALNIMLRSLYRLLYKRVARGVCGFDNAKWERERESSTLARTFAEPLQSTAMKRW